MKWDNDVYLFILLYVEELRPRRLVRVCLLVYLLVYWVVYYIVHLVREHRC